MLNKDYINFFTFMPEYEGDVHGFIVYADTSLSPLECARNVQSRYMANLLANKLNEEYGLEPPITGAKKRLFDRLVANEEDLNNTREFLENIQDQMDDLNIEEDELSNCIAHLHNACDHLENQIKDIECD